MHCGDPYKWCKLKPNDPRKGKENLQHIGGYAWTDFGWFWNNQHVAFCDPFLAQTQLTKKCNGSTKNIELESTSTFITLLTWPGSRH